MSESSRAPVKAAPVPKPALTAARGHVLQRKCACGTSAQGKCGKCDDDLKTPLQRHAAHHQSAPATVPPVVHDVLSAPGRPLDSSTRAFMEPRFGHDFSGVRVHDDSRAADSARAVNARAYTVGQHIAFDRGQYAPNTEDGRHLLAHELAHTVQQGGLQRSPAGGDLAVSSESDPSEREASAVADSVMQGSRPAISTRPSSLSLHRARWGDCPVGTKRKLNEEFGELLKKRQIRKGIEKAKTVKAGFFTQKTAEAAEDFIAFYFKQERGEFAHTNKEPLSPVEGADPETDPEQYMFNAAFDDFRSGGSKRKKKKKSSGASANPPEEPTTPKQAPNVTRPTDPFEINEGRAEEAFEKGFGPYGAQLKPDLVDFKNSEVYDVTTIDGAKEKANKVEGYKDLYESIRVKQGAIGVPVWTVGVTLTPPSKITYGLQNEADPIKICFGPTDFSINRGVIAYEVIDTSGAPGADAGAAGSLSEPYPLVIGGQEMTAYALPGPSETDLLNSGPGNKAIAESVPGVILKKLNRKKGGKDTVEAEIETAENSKSEHKSTVPIVTEGKVPVVYTVNQKTRKLTLRSKKANIPIKYKYLSTGAITELEHSEETGLSGKGYIKPSIKFLSGLDIHFAFAQDSLEVSLPKKKPRIPIPGITVKEVNLTLRLLPKFEPSGTITFTIGTSKRSLVDGVITVWADSNGLQAKADVVTHIPGVDDASGTFIYSPSAGWSGRFTITTSNISFVKSASVTVTLTDGGLGLDGGMEITLPREQRASLKVKKTSDTTWVYTGKGEFRVPKLKPVVFSFVYDGRKVTGSATTSFAFNGLNGEILLAYDNGAVTGNARLEIVKSKGRIKGYLDVTLNKNGKFSGEGKVSYEIKPGLIAEAGIIVDKDEKVTLLGSLRFPPYPLFDRYPKQPKQYDIIPRFSRKIPVPFLSIGPLGVQARIGAGLFVEYGIGPGIIKDGFIKAQVNPLEEDPDPQFELGGSISVPMFFSITGYISGGLVLDLLIAEAGGKFVISATAELAGEGGAKLWAKYAQGEFRAEVDVHLVLELFLKLCISAYVWAEAGVWRFKTRKSKSWNLLDFTFRPGVVLGIEKLKKPFAYSSKTGFELPSFDDIVWAKPKLDEEKMLKSGVDAAGGQPEGPKPRPCPVIDEG